MENKSVEELKVKLDNLRKTPKHFLDIEINNVLSWMDSISNEGLPRKKTCYGCPDRYEGCGRDWYQDIVDFHKYVMLDKFPNIGPHIPYTEKYKALRYKLVREEMEETLEAIQNNDLEKIADGIGDSIVVLLGTAVTYGIDMRPIWNEVHKTNMAKKDGPMREDGKRLKPEGWKPPDIKKLLEEQGYDGNED